MNTRKTSLAGCHCCGLIQQLPVLPARHQAICIRCRTPLEQINTQRNEIAAALSISALIFYLPAMLLPMLQIEQLGHHQSDSLLSGLSGLLTEGYWFVGSIVLIFSVLLPLLKLLSLLVLSRPSLINQHHHRALLYRMVEALGRWGMLDVMLVSILVAFVKLGDLVKIDAGSGLFAFTIMVLLSLLASLAFNPHALWQTHLRNSVDQTIPEQ